jgi:fumarate hydratase subunit alpha
MEKCALLSKKALLRPVDSSNTDTFWNSVEKECLEKINLLGIGPAGFGGKTTALCVNIETFPTHIAGLPVAVNIGCHVTRHAEGIL